MPGVSITCFTYDRRECLYVPFLDDLLVTWFSKVLCERRGMPPSKHELENCKNLIKSSDRCHGISQMSRIYGVRDFNLASSNLEMHIFRQYYFR